MAEPDDPALDEEAVDVDGVYIDPPHDPQGDLDEETNTEPDGQGDAARAAGVTGPGESAAAPSGWLYGVLIALGASLLAFGAMVLAYDPARAGQPSVLYIPGACYALLALATLVLMWRRGEVRARLLPYRGDISIGAVTAAVMYAMAFVGAGVPLPVGSGRSAWLMRLYLHLGDPREQSALVVGLSVLLVAALEELVWRGLVMRALFDVMSEGRAVLLTAFLYALVHVTTLSQLADPLAGPNPLVLAAAAGGGLVWGGIAWRFGRLPPAIFAHALFSWAIIEFPLWHL